MDLGVCETKMDLHILPLGSYYVIIEMDWLAKHQGRVDCYERLHS
jgi:hypothetical protein